MPDEELLELVVYNLENGKNGDTLSALLKEIYEHVGCNELGAQKIAEYRLLVIACTAILMLKSTTFNMNDLQMALYARGKND